MARVQLHDVCKRFGHVTAVESANLSIGDGEFFALLGPSGCGKTTTLRLIAGLETPTSGRIVIGERDVTELAPRDRDVSMVFQDYALYPHMTILDNVGYPLKVRGVPRPEIQSRVGAVAESLRINHLLDRRPAQLSGGQQQRAAVARCVVHSPQVFLFDEPLSNLDAKLRLEARGFLKHLQKEVGITAVYVTHDQAEAMALADRMAVMSEGRIIQVGSPLAVYRRPETTFVASFIGNPPMNLIPCRLALADGSAALSTPSFGLDITPLRPRLAASLHNGDTVMLGIRPEHMTLCAESMPCTMPGQVYAIQPLGSEVLVLVQVDDTTIAVRLFTDDPPLQAQHVHVGLTMERVMLYDSAGRLAVT
jgi:ABC-type sugar transport system ATPase subunit